VAIWGFISFTFLFSSPYPLSLFDARSVGKLQLECGEPASLDVVCVMRTACIIDIIDTYAFTFFVLCESACAWDRILEAPHIYIYLYVECPPPHWTKFPSV